VFGLALTGLSSKGVPANRGAGKRPALRVVTDLSRKD